MSRHSIRCYQGRVIRSANGDNDTVSVLSDSYSTFSSPSQAPSALVVVAVVVVALSVVAIASLVYFKKKGSDRRFRDKVEAVYESQSFVFWSTC